MEKGFHRTFNTCPVCTLREELAKVLGVPELAPRSSKDRFFEQLGNELKARGLARKEWNFRLDVRSGVVTDPTREGAIPIGSKVPGYGIMTDVCMECGCIYAVDLTRTDAERAVTPPPPPGPTRLSGPGGPANRFN